MEEAHLRQTNNQTNLFSPISFLWMAEPFQLTPFSPKFTCVAPRRVRGWQSHKKLNTGVIGNVEQLPECYPSYLHLSQDAKRQLHLALTCFCSSRRSMPPPFPFKRGMWQEDKRVSLSRWPSLLRRKSEGGRESLANLELGYKKNVPEKRLSEAKSFAGTPPSLPAV